MPANSARDLKRMSVQARRVVMRGAPVLGLMETTMSMARQQTWQSSV
jgi:hypothetical protein